MSYSVPDICDDFIDRICVLEPLFSDFGKKHRFCGEIVTIKCFEDNSLVRDAVRSDGRGRVQGRRVRGLRRDRARSGQWAAV
jgi:regulator of ribonuclease activity A